MKSMFSLVSAVLVIIGVGCQPAAVAPPGAPAPAQANSAPAAVWVTVDSPDGSRSPQQLIQIAEQTVAPTLKKLPGAGEVQILGSDQRLAIVDDMPTALIKVTLQPGDASASDFRRAFAEMKSLPVAVNIVLDETTDGIITVELLLPQGSSLEQTQQTAEQAAELVQDIPNVADTVTHFDSEKSNFATMLVKQTGGRPNYSEVAVMLDKNLREVKCYVTGKPAAK